MTCSECGAIEVSDICRSCGASNHPYRRDPQSGAGNCTCGHPEWAWKHPHDFMQAMDDDRCTCGLPVEAACHAVKEADQ